MNFLRLSAVLMIITLFLLPGCGSKDMHGDLTVSAASSAVVAGAADVSFTIKYTRPEGGPYDGVDLAIRTTLDGAPYSSGTEYLSSSGTVTLTYPGINAGSNIRLQARYGDIVSSASITVASATLIVTPLTDWIFTAGQAPGSIKSGTISGGTPPYAYVSSSSPNISGSVSGTVLTVTLLNVVATGGNSATLTVRDSSGQTALVSVTY
jgi:hypothetical protein